MSPTRTAFVLLPGRKDEDDHFQLLQEETALATGKRLDVRVEVAYAPAFDQLRVLKKRLLEGAVDAVVAEPSSVSSMDLLLRELKGRTGLVLLNAWGPQVEAAAREWGREHPLGTVSTDHAGIGRLQGRQLRALVPAGGSVLCVTGPRRSSAAQERLAALREAVGEGVDLLDAEAGEWTEAAGITAFGDWYRIFKARNPVLAAVAAQSDELAMGVRSAIEALADPTHRTVLRQAKLLGVDATPAYGRRLVDDRVLAASVTAPANTGLALEVLRAFWDQGRPLALRSFTRPEPYPKTSA
jgi:ABC-type sugar transport system substrate-binding protein